MGSVTTVIGGCGRPKEALKSTWGSGRLPGGGQGYREPCKLSTNHQCLGPTTEGEKSELGPQEGHSLPGETRCMYTEREQVQGGLYAGDGGGVLWGLRGGGIAWARGSGVGSQIEGVRNVPAKWSIVFS